MIALFTYTNMSNLYLVRSEYEVNDGYNLYCPSEMGSLTPWLLCSIWTEVPEDYWCITDTDWADNGGWEGTTRPVCLLAGTVCNSESEAMGVGICRGQVHHNGWVAYM